MASASQEIFRLHKSSPPSAIVCEKVGSGTEMEHRVASCSYMLSSGVRTIRRDQAQENQTLEPAFWGMS